MILHPVEVQQRIQRLCQYKNEIGFFPYRAILNSMRAGVKSVLLKTSGRVESVCIPG